LLHALGLLAGRPGPAVLAVTCTLAVIVDSTRPRHLPEIGFRVPQSWSRLGLRWFVSAFGVILGFGLLTAVPAAGLYVLLLVSVAGKTWILSAAPFVAFAAGRTAAFASARLGSDVCNGTTLTTRTRAIGQRMRPMWELEWIALSLLALSFVYIAMVGRDT
jgi:hypothetical protein